ncbi:hypothetical protein OIU77_028595 [Salix suchowensis]|uniref:Secreted protein n=1 Tax=Salix suchowensis TaxID=1278906 RepID=A0ABQ9BIC2_9ROSI|nr:hypothetical protein OIU77_028595 [Salix suchowensis]
MHFATSLLFTLQVPILLAISLAHSKTKNHEPISRICRARNVSTECKEGILHERDHISLSESWSSLR